MNIYQKFTLASQFSCTTDNQFLDLTKIFYEALDMCQPRKLVMCLRPTRINNLVFYILTVNCSCSVDVNNHKGNLTACSGPSVAPCLCNFNSCKVGIAALKQSNRCY